MSEYCYDNLKSFLNSWTKNTKYFDMLRMMSQLSRLFSENSAPYLDYRLAENLFCKYYSATNDARSCTAYDARLSHLGIGIKTFILKGKNNDYSTEKIAEFNKLKKTLTGISGVDLAIKIAQYRNERMQFANNLYGVTETQYHIVGRCEGMLRLFNTPYDMVDIESVRLDEDNETSCSFHDRKNHYTFNKSKSVLLKHFEVPENNHVDIKVDILEDPLELLEQFFSSNQPHEFSMAKLKRGVDYVILPLYSYSNTKGCYVPEKSGLNQFNAGGRKRNELEVYIPVPKRIHEMSPDFFPTRNEPFSLILPDGKVLSAKICQDGSKALMSNPNKDLGEWLLRKILRKAPWEIVTMDDLYRFGVDSVCVEKLNMQNNEEQVYKIYFTQELENYMDFISNE